MWQALIPLIGTIVEKAIPDPQAQADAKLKVMELAQKGELAVLDAETKLALGQLEVNKVEAAHGSVFVAGWRPFVGWVCGAGLAAQVIIFPLLDRIFKWQMQFDTELLILTMTGMLGIGGMRTYEKVKGVSTNDFSDVPLPEAEKSPETPAVKPPGEKKKRRFSL